MRLDLLHEAEIFPIVEGYGRTNEFDYSHWQHDPNPKILKLGTWIHPNTRNTLVAGINLNYLTPSQIEKLRYYLPEILRDKNLRRRYWTGRRLMPEVFGEPPNKGAYRTYRADRIQAISPGTLRSMTPAELRKLGDTEKADQLDKRRAELVQKRKEKVPKGMPVREKPPTELEPEADLQFPDQEPTREQPMAPEEPDTTAEKAKEYVDKHQAEKEIAKVDVQGQPEEEPEDERQEPETIDIEPELETQSAEPEPEEEEEESK